MPVDGDIVLKAGLDSSGISKQIGNLQKTISKGLKNAIRIGFGVRSVYALIRKLRTALFKGFEELAQVNQPFNDAMSSIMTSLNLLRNSFASAFAPIIETVAPAVTMFINLIAEAVAKIGQFIAALTGKEYVSAGSIQKDYASSVAGSTANTKKQTSATKQQTKAQKELNREITHFDDLVILHDRNDEDTSASPATTTTPVSAFSTVPIGAAISKFATDFKAAWAKADFTDIGRTVGEKLRNALTKIPWDKIKEVLANIAKSVATFLNGYFSTPGLYYTIGQTVAEGLNSVFTFLYSFITNFDWHNYGLAIKAKILGFLNNIDWNLIYSTMSELGKGLGEAFETGVNDRTVWSRLFTSLSKLLNSLVTTVHDFIWSVEWSNFGRNIARGLNDGMYVFDWNNLSDTLIRLINGVFDTWYGFVEDFEFDKFGEHIGTAVGNVITGIEWDKGGSNVAKTINGLFTALNSFVETTPFDEVGHAVINAIKGFFAELDWGLYADTLSNLLIKLETALMTALEDIEWEKIPDYIIDAIKDFFYHFKWKEVAETTGKLIAIAFNSIISYGSAIWTKLKEFGGKVMEAGKDGIIQAIKDIGTWIKDNILDPFVKGFEEKFDVETFKALGADIWENITDGLKEAVAAIGDFFKDDVSDPVVKEARASFGVDNENGSEFVGIGKSIITQIIKGMANIILNVATWIRTVVVDPIVNTVKSLFGVDESDSEFKTVGSSLIEDLKDGISSALTDIIKWIQDTITDPIIDGIKGFFFDSGGLSVLFSIGSDLVGGLKSGIDAAMEGIDAVGGWLDKHLVSPVVGGVKDLFGIDGNSSETFEEMGHTFGGGLGRGFEEKSDEPVDVAKDVRSDLTDVFGAASQLIAWTKLGSNLMSLGLKVGILAMQPSIKTIVQNFEKDLRTIFSNSANSWRLAGVNLMVYFQMGLQNRYPELTKSLTSTLETLLQQVTNSVTMFQKLGESLMNSLATGITNNKGKAESASNGVLASMYNSANKLNWWNVGYNIAVGIYNGLFAHSSWLEVLAWNTAVRMYNSACRALGIHSPSRKFAYVGEMITEGMGEGIADNQDNAVNAVTDMTDAIVDEAEKNSPTVALDTSINDWIDKLDDVLTQFSDTIISKFDSMASVFAGLGNISASVPAVAQGKVVPAYATAYGASSEDVSSVKGLLENLTANQLTVEDLRPLLVEMFNEYMNLGWYVGDEQLARHVNNGNLILDRRYSKIK